MPKLHADGTVTDATQVAPDPNVELATPDVIEPASESEPEPAPDPAAEIPAPRRRTRGVASKDSR